MSDRCKTCGQPVIWANNDKTGKSAPIDAGMDPNGPIILLPEGKYRVLAKAECAELLRRETHTSHWQTCVDRAAWKEAYSRG